MEKLKTKKIDKVVLCVRKKGEKKTGKIKLLELYSI